LDINTVSGVARALREIRPTWSGYCEYRLGLAIGTAPGVPTDVGLIHTAGCGLEALLRERIPVGLSANYVLSTVGGIGYLDATVGGGISAVLIVMDVGFEL
jgi:hypothetical protein